jgi:hypothetical protein
MLVDNNTCKYLLSIRRRRRSICESNLIVILCVEIMCKTYINVNSNLLSLVKEIPLRVISNKIFERGIVRIVKS